MLRDSVVVVVRTRPRAIPLAMITVRKSTLGFPFVFHIWDAYGAPLGSPSGRRSSTIKLQEFTRLRQPRTMQVYDHLFVFISLNFTPVDRAEISHTNRQNLSWSPNQPG